MLSRVMLRAVEVAVELWLGLSWSPQAQLLNDATQRNVLAEEVGPLLVLIPLSWLAFFYWIK
jgi:hypothetical protein